MLLKFGNHNDREEQKDDCLDEVFRSFDSLFSGISRIENTELRALLLRDVIGTATAAYESLPGRSRVSPARRGSSDDRFSEGAQEERRPWFS